MTGPEHRIRQGEPAFPDAPSTAGLDAGSGRPDRLPALLIALLLLGAALGLSLGWP